MNADKIVSSLLSPEMNDFQIWALQNPEDKKSKAVLPLLSFVEGLVANDPTFLDKKRRLFGKNFCCSGQVVMGEFETLEAALTSPQARSWRLGASLLDADNAPNEDIGGRNVFLLALSDEAAGGNGDHEAFSRCMQHYLINEAAIARQQDSVAKGLLDQLASDYQTMPHDAGGEFFKDVKQGLMRFMIRYLHYVLFGLDPDDQAANDLLADLHYARKSAAHYFAGLGDTF
ncbi:MAG: cytochrome 450, partial [Cyanobacteria bacterium P01_F01_bin.53]